ncbi:MAG: hypothetical protein LC808_35250 [Actinobacteria bacterium]|nr:hypothetical protein [Actinomycetota bacterium]
MPTTLRLRPDANTLPYLGREALSARFRTAAAPFAVRSEKLGEVADEFDDVHSVERTLRVGSIDAIIPAASLRPQLIEAVERGIQRRHED